MKDFATHSADMLLELLEIETNKNRTLLKVGDEITIRNDIENLKSYSMILNSESTNTYIRKRMIEPGTLVRVVEIDANNQYRVIDCSRDPNDTNNNEVYWSYTDLMFDPELLQIILEERFN